MSRSKPVLISWVAVRTDPYERENDGSFRQHKGNPVPGPTLTLLTDPDSPYRGEIRDAVFIRQSGGDGDEIDHARVYEQLCGALERACPTLRLHPEVWGGTDPTDLTALFTFTRDLLSKIRRKFPDRELVIHVSPGTPSMQTVWILLAEVGLVEGRVTLVRSFRSKERRGRPAVVPVTLNIDTLYRRFRATRPAAAGTQEQAVRWDPARFKSAGLRSLAREARRVAALRVPALIVGERGTGKTTLASWIRVTSPYRKPELDANWPAVACGQYTPETMRAELFGYVKGAFTGANNNHDGLLARADGDTLFLDEVGDISRDLQRLLIKAVEERCFLPLGATDLRRSEFRLLSATNIEMGTLRERVDADFFDRIATFVLRLPPLREITEDLDWLWDGALSEATTRAKVSESYALMPESVRLKIIAALRVHPLPGNLRDLFRVAWRFLAARADDLEPMPPGDAAEDALRALDDAFTSSPPPEAEQDPARAAAAAFARGAPLPDVLVRDAPFSSTRLIDALGAWMASSIREIAQRQRRPVSELIDRDERTLRTWLRKNFSG